jgi:hypothetical protein
MMDVQPIRGAEPRAIDELPLFGFTLDRDRGFALVSTDPYSACACPPEKR